MDCWSFLSLVSAPATRPQDLKEATKESAQRAQRAEQLEGRLRKTDNKLIAAKKQMSAAVETVRSSFVFLLPSAAPIAFLLINPQHCIPHLFIASHPPRR